MRVAFIAVLSLVCIFGTFTKINAEEEDPIVKECLKKTRGELKKLMKLFNACNKELGSKDKTPEQFQESIGCVVKCVMHKAGVLDDQNKLTMETMKKAIEEKIPEKYRQHIHDMGVDCITKYGGDKLDDKDPNCKSYQTLATCIQEVYADVCGKLPPM